MFFDEHLKEYLDGSLVASRKVKVAQRERFKTGLHNRLTNIARTRAEADQRREKEPHGLLVVYGDFSGEVVGVRPPPKFPLPTIIGKSVTDESFVLARRGTDESITYSSFTDVLNRLSGIDSAWLIHTDGTILGPGYKLHNGGDAVVEDGWGTGTESAKYYSAFAHVWATYKLSGEADKRVRMFERLKVVNSYDPYEVIKRSAAAKSSTTSE